MQTPVIPAFSSGPSRALKKVKGKWLHHLHFNAFHTKVTFPRATFSGFWTSQPKEYIWGAELQVSQEQKINKARVLLHEEY